MGPDPRFGEILADGLDLILVREMLEAQTGFVIPDPVHLTGIFVNITLVVDAP